MKDLSVKFDLENSEYFTALRLVAGAVCSLAERDVDAAEDFKVCVTEGALILKNCGFKSVNAVFSAQGSARACLTGEGGAPAEGENELSLALIGALVESCSIDKKDGVISSLTLEL